MLTLLCSYAYTSLHYSNMELFYYIEFHFHLRECLYRGIDHLTVFVRVQLLIMQECFNVKYRTQSMKMDLQLGNCMLLHLHPKYFSR